MAEGPLLEGEIHRTRLLGEGPCEDALGSGRKAGQVTFPRAESTGEWRDGIHAHGEQEHTPRSSPQLTGRL